MMAYSVHLLAYTVHHVRLLIYMIGYADHLMANAVHPSEKYTQVKLLMYMIASAVHLIGLYASDDTMWGSWFTW